MKQQENRAEPQEKLIRFIDRHYNLKFNIPDGGKIRITFRDGHTADRVYDTAILAVQHACEKRVAAL